MKHLAYLYKIIAITLSLSLFIPQFVFADTSVDVSNNSDSSSNSVSVNSASSGQSVTCVNGNCTTTGGNSKSTVCINGHCTTTDGNVDYSSSDGHDQVHIQNNTGDNSVTISPFPTQTPTPSNTPVPTISETPSITPDPTITKMRNDIDKHVSKELDVVKNHFKDQNAAISAFFKNEMDVLNNLFSGLFK